MNVRRLCGCHIECVGCVGYFFQYVLPNKQQTMIDFRCSKKGQKQISFANYEDHNEQMKCVYMG